MSMEIVYIRSGDFLFPVEKSALTKVQESMEIRAGKSKLAVVEESMETQPGKYARMREDYLAKNKSILYQALLISGELEEHLEETERMAQKRMEELMKAFLVKYPSPERTDMIAWTAHRNSLTEMAEETVRSEIIYR